MLVLEQLSLDLLRDWLAENLKDLALDGEEGNLSINGLAPYQPFDGLMELKMVSKRPGFCSLCFTWVLAFLFLLMFVCKLCLIMLLFHSFFLSFFSLTFPVLLIYLVNSRNFTLDAL